MPLSRLKAHADVLRGLSPEGVHVDHMFGTLEEKAAFVLRIEAEKDRNFRNALIQQLKKFVVIDPEHAEHHADIMARKSTAAGELVTALGLDGAGKEGVIAGPDALRYLVKTFRELRHALHNGNGADLDLEPAVAAVAEHLGVTNVAPIRAGLEAEHAAFKADHATAKERLGDNAVFHEDCGFVDDRLQDPSAISGHLVALRKGQSK